MLEQLEKVLGETHVPAKEKLLWLVNNAGSLRWVSGRKKDFSSRIFLILKKKKVSAPVLHPQQHDVRAVLIPEYV